MSRLHVHISVEDLEQSIAFYSALLGAEPSRREPDYARWLLDEPRVALAISAYGRPPGLAHLGVRADDPDELAAIQTRLEAADLVEQREDAITCCYARSNKSWTVDPSGVAWEVFHTLSDAGANAQEAGAAG